MQGNEMQEMSNNLLFKMYNTLSWCTFFEKTKKNVNTPGKDLIYTEIKYSHHTQ